MVTLDNIVKNVPEFNGDLEGNRIFYETARQGLARITEETTKFDLSLKAKTGYDNFILPPEEGDEATYRQGSASFTIKSERRIKRPAYKEVVVGLETHLQGIGFLAGTGRTIAHVAKKGNDYYIDAERLEEDFAILVHNALKPEVKHTITYEAIGILAKLAADPQSIVDICVPLDMSRYNREVAETYVLMQLVKPNLEAFATAYEAILAGRHENKEEKIVNVGGGDAYRVAKSTSRGADWALVTRTLYLIPKVKKCVGELNTLADENLTISEKKRKLPDYTLWERDVNGQSRTYVSLSSVYERIQALKGEETLQARRQSISGVKVV
jgi:hypothetical protein